jgi:cytoskeletal protein CcmA (bactofilin family)
MKHHTFSILGAALLLLLTLVITGAQIASAHEFKSGTNVTTSPDQKINHTLFASGRTVNISSEVFGDVFAAGQTVTVTGTVHGDVFAAGQTVSVSGKVDGDVRLAGQTVTLSAPVSGSATAAGQSFALDSRSSVGRDLTAAATDISIDGMVSRDAALAGDTGVISGTIGRNVQAGSNHLRLASTAKVSGNVDVTSHEDVKKDSGATVGGKITRTEPEEHKQAAAKRHSAAWVFAWFVYWLLAMLVISLVLALVVPHALESVTDEAFPRPWIALLTGFLGGIVVPVVLLVLTATLIGLPLAFLLGLIWLVILILSVPLSAYYIGRLVFHGPRHALLTMLVGAGILIVLYFIPVLCFLFMLAAAWLGSGMLLLDLYRRFPRPVYHQTAA